MRKRTPKTPRIIRMQAPGLYQPPEEKPSPEVLAARLVDDEGLHRFLAPSQDGLQARLEQIKVPTNNQEE